MNDENIFTRTFPVKVSVESLFYYKGTKYSVSPKYIAQTLKLEEKDNKLYVYYNKNLITVHDISDKKIQYKEDHYKECLRETIDKNSTVDIDALAEKNLELLSKLTK